MNINVKCPVCGGDGLVPVELSGGSAGAPTYTCPKCGGVGMLVFGVVVDLGEKFTDLDAKLDDILDKCDDILEKLNEE